ncbi:MAG: hypothetical protein J5I62_14270 [Flavobacteriales bacterium]|nr:hypothetical protein [Flavobacteriales bacterium]MEB2341417.1 3-deoxy-D-manno-octulosonic acid transferase [Flavobacteriia bacterium]
MPLLYDLGTRAYHAALCVAGPWNPKAKAWVQLRKGQWKRMEEAAPRLQGCLWMHCASVGEFEQGRPVLEAIKQQRPELPVLLTFFSPSGYEAAKAFPLATHVDLLPPDGRRNAERMQRLVKPRAAVFVKYEFWYHHLRALGERQVPTFLVSALFRKDQPFFRWYGGAWRRMLRTFTMIFTQDEASRRLVAPLVQGRAVVGGDTRFDRVAAIRAEGKELPLARAWAGHSPVLVCGSTWPPDEQLLAQALHAMGTAAPKCLLVPHELHEAQLQRAEQLFPKPLVRWGELENGDAANLAATLGKERQGTLLVDRMGLLARLYGHGRVAYVGGGFTDGIHSLLEAAAWGIPVIFGPKHRKFPEARGLIDAGAGREVRDADELLLALEHWFSDPEALHRASTAASAYVQQRTGSAKAVAEAVLAAI